jgi:hypothetical protein
MGGEERFGRIVGNGHPFQQFGFILGFWQIFKVVKILGEIGCHIIRFLD